MTVLTSKPLPGSIRQFVAACSDTVKVCKKEIEKALGDRKAALDTFYGLIGKVVVYREYQGFRNKRTRTFRVRIDRIHYGDDGSIQYITGTILPQDGSPGFTNKEISSSAIAAGQVEIETGEQENG
jgi:hypothetical protein